MDLNLLDEPFSGRILKNMRDLRGKRILIDFTIQVDEEVFPVHKFLLAACSDYFKAMFTSNTIESRQGQVCFEKDITAEAMGAILDFCYGSEIHIGTDNVQDILMASSILQIDEIQNLCVNYIKEGLDSSNCLGIMIVADRCNSDLYQGALDYCLHQFESIIEENEFLDLELDCLSKMISDNRLNITSEEKLFYAIIKWITAKNHLTMAERMNKLESLMAHIRLPLMDPEELIRVSQHELVNQSMKCRSFVDEAKDFLLLWSCYKNNPKVRSLITGSRFQPRIRQLQKLKRQQCLYAVGGWADGGSLSKVEKYDPKTNSWTEIKPMNRPRCGVGVTIVDDCLYAIGGHDGSKYLKSAERYDILEKTWSTDISDMSLERTSVGVVSIGQYIYAIGGQIISHMQAKPEATSKMERYDIITNKWEECKPMLEKRMGAGVVVLDGLIYVMGGVDNRHDNHSVECYDPASDSWTYRAPMITTRKHSGCATLGGKIYAVGGRIDSSSSNELDNAECYDPKTDTWTAIANMSVKRSGISLASLDNLIYAVGGATGGKNLNLVEAYNPVTGAWYPKHHMFYDRLGCGLTEYLPTFLHLLVKE